jgi:hypothetical protein
MNQARRRAWSRARQQSCTATMYSLLGGDVYRYGMNRSLRPWNMARTSPTEWPRCRIREGAREHRRFGDCRAVVAFYRYYDKIFLILGATFAGNTEARAEIVDLSSCIGQDCSIIMHASTARYASETKIFDADRLPIIPLRFYARQNSESTCRLRSMGNPPSSMNTMQCVSETKIVSALKEFAFINKGQYFQFKSYRGIGVFLSNSTMNTSTVLELQTRVGPGRA